MDEPPVPDTPFADLFRRLDDVRDRLRALADANPVPEPRGVNGWARVFGSEGHRWVSRPVTQDSLDELSRFLGTRLPAEVEEFLRVIGSGAGPYYGIFTPSDIRGEVQSARDDCAAEQVEPPHSGRAFPITAAHVRDELVPVRPYPLDGAVRLCHRGCATWTILAITGELAGTVWNVNAHDREWDDAAEWRPATYPNHGHVDGQPVYFLDWYEHWLDFYTKPTA
jgi:hypothetical protein